jgi:putative RecB family exonuclease
MELQKLRTKEHLSASSINDYVECGLHFKFRRIDRIESEFQSESLEFGSIIHEVLGEYYRNKQVGIKPSLKQLQKVFKDLSKKRVEDNDEIEFAEGHDYDTFLRTGKDLLATWYESLPTDDFRVLAVERPFSFSIDGTKVPPIIGAIDLLEEDPAGTIIVSDFKTSRSAYSNDKIDKSFQLTLYYMAMKAEEFADRDILLRFDCLIKTKTPKFEQYYTTRSEEDVQRAVKKIRYVWESIQKGVFIPHDGSWKCGGCEYQENCDAWFLQEE